MYLTGMITQLVKAVQVNQLANANDYTGPAANYFYR